MAGRQTRVAGNRGPFAFQTHAQRRFGLASGSVASLQHVMRGSAWSRQITAPLKR